MNHPAPHGYVTFTTNHNRLLIPVDIYNEILPKCLVIDGKWNSNLKDYELIVATERATPPVHFVSSAEIAGILVAAKLDPAT